MTKQINVVERQDAIVFGMARVMARRSESRGLPCVCTEANQGQWRAQAVERVVGSGFFDTYQHASVLRAWVGSISDYSQHLFVTWLMPPARDGALSETSVRL